MFHGVFVLPVLFQSILFICVQEADHFHCMYAEYCPLFTSRLIVALSVTFGMFLIELVGFLTGVSMFNSTQNLICILLLSSESMKYPAVKAPDRLLANVRG